MPSLVAVIRNSGFTLSELHRRTGVARPTLSRITNGHQKMSRRTVNKLAPVLGVSPEDLLRAQTSQPAAPEMVRISALQLKQWGETRRAEEELPALVDRLIRSELFASGVTRAPTGERIVERGQDIAVNNPASATRHIPSGQSVWEVSTDKKKKEKANKDVSRHSLPTDWQHQDTSYLFVTTWPWTDGSEWASQQLPKHPWKFIRVLDATDLQSWIEEAPGVQLWLMERMGLSFVRDGFQWLRTASQEWSAVANPPLTPALLQSSVDRHFTAWRAWLDAPSPLPLTIIGESRGEALLFIQALIEHGATQDSLFPLEGLCVNTAEALRHLVGSPSPDVVVIPTNDRVRDLAIAYSNVLRVVVPATGQPRVLNPLVVGSAGTRAVRDFLIAGGIDNGRASRLARSSGGSIGVLRRLTHKCGPEAPESQVPARLSPILAVAGLFGIWDAGSQADRKVVLRLTGQRRYEDLEQAWTELLNLPESPVWMDGERRGVNSRLDTWQRFTEGEVIPQAIDRYFSTVGVALREVPLVRPQDFPFPPEDFQTLRDSQVSSELLRGLAQGLALLAAFGDNVDRRLTGPSVVLRVNQVVGTALKHFTVDRLRALHTILPLLAEAAPEMFLEMMEADLQQVDSAQKALLNFRNGDDDASEPTLHLLDSTNALYYRSSLMEAYEAVAWFPEYTEQAINLLSLLADKKVLDHHGGQPRQSLETLLNPWYCGSAIESERHCVMLRKIAARYPEWTFDWVCEWLPPGPEVAETAYLPLWRGQTDGANSKRPQEHQMVVCQTASDILFQHAATSGQTIHAAIRALNVLSPGESSRIWKCVSTWMNSDSCNDEERATLVRHLTAIAHGELSLYTREDIREEAVRILGELSDIPVEAPVAWLFDDDASIREYRSDDSDWEVTFERLEQKRCLTLRELLDAGGIDDILSLVPSIENTRLLGTVASRVLSTDEVHSVVSRALQTGGDDARSPLRQFIQELLDQIDDVDADALTDEIQSSSFAKQNPVWLPCLLACLPLELGSVRADRLSGQELKRYWELFDPGRYVIPPERKDWLITGLCSVGRPRKALLALRADFEGAQTESLLFLIDTLLRSTEQVPHSKQHKLDTGETELITAIRKRSDLSPADAERIEFLFFHMFEPDAMPALAKSVASSPAWLQDALMLCTTRRDGGDDPPEWTERKNNAPEGLQRRAYRLFQWLPRLPGTTSSGFDVHQGVAWTEKFLTFAEEHDRREDAESLLGSVFGNAGFHEDGSPTDELTQLLEQIRCTRIEQGIVTVVGSRLGAVVLPDGGAGRPFHKLADFYRELELRYRDSAPRTARVLRLLQREFTSLERWADDHQRLQNHLDAHG